MTMRVVFLKEHEGNKVGKETVIERTLGQRLCVKGIIIPYAQHVQKQAAEKREAKEAADLKKKVADQKKLEAEAKKADEKKKKDEESPKKETATSKKFLNRKKATTD